jgi:hypothetical protein
MGTVRVSFLWEGGGGERSTELQIVKNKRFLLRASLLIPSVSLYYLGEELAYGLHSENCAAYLLLVQQAAMSSG